MKLRSILMILSLLAFISAATGGYFYYNTLKASAYKEAKRQAATRVQIIQKNLSSYLAENIRPVAALAGMDALRQALLQPDANTLEKTNKLLDHFKNAFKMDVCYLMDAAGETIASSNRHAADSFVGQNFSFRPYFKQAIAGNPATYLALGATSGRRGAYASHPIYAQGRKAPLGIVVIKAEIALIERELGPAWDETVLVTDPNGIIFISNRQDWRYGLLWQADQRKLDHIANSRQFGPGPWTWTGLTRIDNNHAMDAEGVHYLLQKCPIRLGKKAMIKVLLADDHSIVRAGLHRIVEESGNMAVVAEAADGHEAIRMVRQTMPDVAVVDISMPGLDGLEVVSRLHDEFPKLPILILTMHVEDQYIVRAVEAGAMGYLTKQSAPEQLVSAIRRVIRGRRYLSESAVEALALRVARGTPSLIDTLSQRELQVLRRLALGNTNREIADAYYISIKTVDTYRFRLLKKLNLRNNADLSRFAIHHRLIET